MGGSHYFSGYWQVSMFPLIPFPLILFRLLDGEEADNLNWCSNWRFYACPLVDFLSTETNIYITQIRSRTNELSARQQPCRVFQYYVRKTSINKPTRARYSAHSNALRSFKLKQQGRLKQIFFFTISFLLPPLARDTMTEESNERRWYAFYRVIYLGLLQNATCFQERRTPSVALIIPHKLKKANLALTILAEK